MELLAWREGRGWVDMKSSDINAYIRRVAGDDYSAKVRTWHATVLAALALAVSNEAKPSPHQRRRAVVRAVKEVASYLGNTPAVARSSYIDPRVISNFERGRTIDLACLDQATSEHGLPTHGPVEEATLRLLTAGRRRV